MAFLVLVVGGLIPGTVVGGKDHERLLLNVQILERRKNKSYMVVEFADAEFARTYFTSITRRIFATVGVDQAKSKCGPAPQSDDDIVDDQSVRLERTNSGQSVEMRVRIEGFRDHSSADDVDAQIALELNFINPRRANALDEDWGINSSFFFFELAGSNANSRAPVGDKFYFTGGVGITF